MTDRETELLRTVEHLDAELREARRFIRDLGDMICVKDEYGEPCPHCLFADGASFVAFQERAKANATILEDIVAKAR